MVKKGIQPDFVCMQHLKAGRNTQHRGFEPRPSAKVEYRENWSSRLLRYLGPLGWQQVAGHLATHQQEKMEWEKKRSKTHEKKDWLTENQTDRQSKTKTSKNKTDKIEWKTKMERKRDRQPARQTDTYEKHIEKRHGNKVMNKKENTTDRQTDRQTGK